MTMTWIEAKPLTFALQVDENIPLALCGDMLRIKQILNNLLSNAFKYTDEGAITLSVAAEPGRGVESADITLVFRVADTGQGMTAQQTRDLFSEYSRFNLDVNRAVQGAGLGMNITRGLVRLMDGEIFVESEPGKGSTFTVRIPQKATNPIVFGKELAHRLMHFDQAQHASETDYAQIAYEPMPYGRVLIVDDVDMNIFVAEGMMSPYELSIDTASSGFEAIEKIRSGNVYDIVFMDYMMPQMDGVETTKMLRDQGYRRPIVALTANVLTDQVEMLLANGFDGYIPKPLDAQRLDGLLNRLIRDRQPSEVIEAARRQLANVFVREAENAVMALKALHTYHYRRDADAYMFADNAHALKSALVRLGEAELAAFAHKMEQAGRKHDIAVLSAETPVFLEALRAMIEKITPKEEDAGNGTARSNPG
jgi:signal transduction histidine kinase